MLAAADAEGKGVRLNVLAVPAMSDPWRVRPATPQDRVFIVEIARQASVLEGRPLPAANSDDVRSVLPSNDDDVIVAENLLGRPAGAGGALLDELAQRCTQRYDALCLNVHQNNPARALYRRHGFDEIGQGRGARGVSMRKDFRGIPGMGGGGK
ncbi:hypothetical protein A5740_21665 [Mycobacterium sp. GA-1841]|nr:hypothetical protein A5740_21665 [Mycobacterium sp. GA-1841]